MQEPSTPAQKERISPSENSNSAYVYMVLPFRVVRRKKGDLFEPGIHEILNQEELQEVVDKLTNKLNSIADNTGKKRSALGDFTKYYDFMKGYFGNPGEVGNPGQSCEFMVFKVNTSQMRPRTGFESYSNLQAQFAQGAYLGESDIQMKKLDEVWLMVNSAAGIGFFVFGFECYSSGGEIAGKLAECEFFRNVGWRRDQKLGPAQLQKHQWSFEGEKAPKGLTMHQTLNCYFSCPSESDPSVSERPDSDLSDCIRFYQDRPVVLYTVPSINMGNQSNDVLGDLAYEIIRVPDRNATRFDTPITEPSIQRVGRNVAFAALNEGALIIESFNANSSVKSTANKYFPAFILAINQRELLLNMMQRIAQLDSRELKIMSEPMFLTIENLRNSLLVLKLKQIFYSVSNLHEVELFFNQLQRAFAVEKMLMENEQSIREMYNLLEVRRNNELERIENEKARRDDRRSNIINTILGAIGCLGLFEFLKDFMPFINDSVTYMLWYKAFSILLPIGVMAYLIRLVFFAKK